VDSNLEFSAGWFADPVYFGKYPESMIANVGDRLPTFTREQQRRIKGSSDFYGTFDDLSTRLSGLVFLC
jgi:beta-glucosidase